MLFAMAVPSIFLAVIASEELENPLFCVATNGGRQEHKLVEVGLKLDDLTRRRFRPHVRQRLTATTGEVGELVEFEALTRSRGYGGKSIAIPARCDRVLG